MHSSDPLPDPARAGDSPPGARPVRARFAPSPTGSMHVGNARSALYSWLFARQHGGALVLRIEDTDRERHQEEAVEGIQRTLSWLGIDWDEGPYRQTERLHLYAEAAERLRAAGRAYWAEHRVAGSHEGRAKQDIPPVAERDRTDLGPGEDRVLRFAVPPGSTTITDVVRGEVAFDHDHVEDFTIVRSSGMPTFLLAVTVDDMAMEISHVIRAEEHLPNAPKQTLLWRALGGDEPPVWAHLPLLVDAQRRKLSKRRDRVAVEDYRGEGYLPEAIVNYLALLGWSPRDDREFLSPEEIVELFRLDHVKSSPAFFDTVKMTHLNGLHLRALAPEDFRARSQPFLPEGASWEPVAELAPLVQERVATLAEAGDMLAFLFTGDAGVLGDEAVEALARQPASRPVIDAAIEVYADVEWSAAELHAATVRIGEGQGLKLRKAQAPIRLAVTGRSVGLPLFESLETLGRERALARLRLAAERLEAAA